MNAASPLRCGGARLSQTSSCTHIAAAARRVLAPTLRQRRLLGVARPTVAAALAALPPRTKPSTAFASLLSCDALRSDAHQATVLPLLDALHADSLAAVPAPPPPAATGWWGSLLRSPPAPATPPIARGLYLWGGTGCGKTLLLDLFVACAPFARRVHYHSFMLDVHARLHQIRSGHAGPDPLTLVARDLIHEGGTLLCLDELQVTEVGDAMLMRRLFDALFARGLTLFATSNRPPEALYMSGLQREFFTPFIASVTTHCTVHELSSPTDHRLIAGGLGQGVKGGGSSELIVGEDTDWLSPAQGLCPHEHAAATASVAAAFETAWQRGIRAAPVGRQTLAIPGQGRELLVTRAAPLARAARFSFAELCAVPLYAADYAAIANAYGHVFVEGVPRLTMSSRNELRRFVTLIDVLYDHRVRLSCSAETPPQAVFVAEDASAGPVTASGERAPGARLAPSSTAAVQARAQYDEVFAWDRALSRLIEMASASYRREVPR